MFFRRTLQCTLFFALIALVSLAAQANGQKKTLGNPKAPQGGTFQLVMGSEPTTLNPFSSSDVYAQQVQGYVMDSLMERNSDTYEWEPAVAERYEKAKDGKSFTFYIREGVKFHDGKPVTVEDVKFSFDAIFDDRYKAARIRPYYENIKSAEIVGKNAIKFSVKDLYFGNFDVVASIAVIPKHVYGDPKKKNNKKLIGSGPYSLLAGKYKKGKSILLKRNPQWWGRNVPYYKGTYNFDAILFRFIKEENIQLESLKKGRLDYVGLTPEAYTKKTSGKLWKKRLIKVKAQNKQPVGYGFIGWNFKHTIFKDKKVRLALAHLADREQMNKKFRFGMSMPATGPWYQQSPYADASIKPIPFDPVKAKKLLTEAGWKDADKDGVLEKKIDGKLKKFEFSLMFSNRDFEKYYTLYKQDLKKSGIICNLKLVEWNSLVAALNDRKFESVSLGWGAGSVDNDPKQIWHSESMRTGGSNFISYNNPKVDKLIDKGRKELDKKKRIKIYNKIYREISEDAPYLFLFNNRYLLYAHSNKIKKPTEAFQYAIGSHLWWTEIK